MNICENGAKRRISGCHGANAMSRTHQELIYSAAAHHCAPSSSNLRSSVDRPIHGHHFGIGAFLLVKKVCPWSCSAVGLTIDPCHFCRCGSNMWPPADSCCLAAAEDGSVLPLPLWLIPVAPVDHHTLNLSKRLRCMAARQLSAKGACQPLVSSCVADPSVACAQQGQRWGGRIATRPCSRL